jgi:hypothetical protein
LGIATGDHVEGVGREQSPTNGDFQLSQYRMDASAKTLSEAE